MFNTAAAAVQVVIRTVHAMEKIESVKESDEESAKRLRFSVDRIFDETNKMARSRNRVISDKEQMNVLAASLNALRAGNVENAAKVLEERLSKLSRRISLRELDEDDENSAFREQFQQPSCLPSQPQIFDSNISTDAWMELCGGLMSIGCTEDNAQVAPSIPDDLSEDRVALQAQGFLHGDSFEPAASLSEPILKVHTFTNRLLYLLSC